MNRCPDNTDWVLYAAGELDEPRRAALAAHLDGCDACRAEVAALARGLTALDALEREPAMRPEAFEALRRRLGVAAAHAAARPRARTILYRYRWVAAAAVLVAAAVVYSLLPATNQTPVRHQWLDEDQFVSELAEITAGVEILEIGDYTVAADNSNGADTDAADAPAGQSRRPVGDEPVRLAFAG
ncbi:MAG: zf-HC2 domain-containing protein [Acidobacteria bacterium]|nr:zf-HC2 domain-containing protein [Planctomycetota bacterium]MBE3131897.1 zf-HC2 domain-containing protein [Acidobacteriota bacterium]